MEPIRFGDGGAWIMLWENQVKIRLNAVFSLRSG